MPRKVSEIVAEARQLPYGERAELVEQLIAANAQDLDPKIEKAWGDEAMRRLKELEDGKVKGVPLEEALAPGAQDRRVVKPVILHPEALEEFDAAAAYYTGIDPVLGQRFYDVIHRLIAEAGASPGMFRIIRDPARRHFTRDFPYGIIYVERPDDLWILAVMHLHREPNYWKHRLQQP